MTGCKTRFSDMVRAAEPVEPQHCVAMAVAFYVACEHILPAAAAAAAAAEMNVHCSH